MNVYDFDGTIFSSDCSIGFCIWCMKRRPKLWFTFAPKTVKNMILKKRGKIPDGPPIWKNKRQIKRMRKICRY